MDANARYEVSELDPPPEALGRPDLHLGAVSDAGSVGARCSLWWQQAPQLPGERVGLLGHFEAEDHGAASLLIEHSCTRLSSEGCSLAVAPIDGDVWHRYRLVVERGTEPPFFLEPNTPDSWVDHFTLNGFSVMARYLSAATDDLDGAVLRAERHSARLQAQGIQFRHPDLSQWQDELRRLYPLILEAFRNQLLFSSIDEQEFVELYQPIRPVLRPELMFVAEHNRQPVGFLFAVPDMLQSRRGFIDTVIIQVVAVHPAYERYGMGTYMVQRAYDAARDGGFRRAVHALMQEGKASARLTQRYFKQRVIRRYALFSRRLQP